MVAFTSPFCYPMGDLVEIGRQARAFSDRFLGGTFYCAQSDMIGNLLGLWSYQYQLLPLQPKLVPIDFAVFPVVYMLIYQYFQNWRSYVIASLVTALVFAFIGEPLLVHLGIYKIQNWQHWYSFPIYVIIFFIKWLVDSSQKVM